mmetsp:Transcript_28065/g.57617  ORF Transcript_28065/g.57617 Transcript_28065/m.57617 type:complete len:249 (+) Transcript_28065:383-1129(+)
MFPLSIVSPSAPKKSSSATFRSAAALSANAAALEMEKVSFSNRRSVVTRKLTVTREFVCPAAAALAEAIAASNPSSSSTLAPLTASKIMPFRTPARSACPPGLVLRTVLVSMSRRQPNGTDAPSLSKSSRTTSRTVRCITLRRPYPSRSATTRPSTAPTASLSSVPSSTHTRLLSMMYSNAGSSDSPTMRSLSTSGPFLNSLHTLAQLASGNSSLRRFIISSASICAGFMSDMWSMTSGTPCGLPSRG